jgi:hypothetical protein
VGALSFVLLTIRVRDAWRAKGSFYGRNRRFAVFSRLVRWLRPISARTQTWLSFWSREAQDEVSHFPEGREESFEGSDPAEKT